MLSLLGTYRPAFRVMLPFSVILWTSISLTALFGPAQWTSSETLTYVRIVPDSIWGIGAGTVVAGLIYGVAAQSWSTLRAALGLALFVAMVRTLLISATIPAGIVTGINAAPAWWFIWAAHFSMARAPFVAIDR